MLKKQSLVHSYSVLFWLHNKWQSFITLAVQVGSKVQRTELHQTSVLADLGPLEMEPRSLFTSEFGPITSNANGSCTNDKDLLPETHLSPSVQTRQPCFKRFLSLHVLLTLLLHFLFLLFLESLPTSLLSHCCSFGSSQSLFVLGSRRFRYNVDNFVFLLDLPLSGNTNILYSQK